MSHMARVRRPRSSFRAEPTGVAGAGAGAGEGRGEGEVNKRRVMWLARFGQGVATRSERERETDRPATPGLVE